MEKEVRDSVAARKVQKADREKLRRDKLNEQFAELGKALDPDRPKNDKATILNDAIQMLKDLNAQVSRLKSEYASLSDESHELTREKNELREEKSALKTDIDNLFVQYQQRVRVVYPWSTMDPSTIIGAPPFPYAMPIPVPSAPIPMHPSLQPFPFFRNQNPGSVSTPYPIYPSYSPPLNPQTDHPSTQYAPPNLQPSSTNGTQTSNEQETRNKSTCADIGISNRERSCASNDVVTDLELKTPGSAVPSSCREPGSQMGKSSGGRKGKRCLSPTKGVSIAESSNKCSSSHSRQESSSNSVGNGSIAND